MFSSNDLISYVFANDRDTYYGSDLLALDLERYLWRSLHRDYHVVYFLQGTDDGLFTVRTFGDRDAQPYSLPKRRSSPATENAFGDWLLSQLCRRDHPAAFVCPMETFCRVLSRDAWTPVLDRLANEKKRTGIIVLTVSPYAEDSQELLLNSPVFNHLKEAAVTESRPDKDSREQLSNSPQGEDCHLYASIRKKKTDHFLCLNAFTPERVRDLLLHVYSADPARRLPHCGLDTLARYLAAYLQGTMPLPEPLADAFPSRLYLTYAQLHDLLRDRSVWDLALDTVQALLHDRFTEPDASPLSIQRDPKCYAGRCLTLRLPDWVCDRTALLSLPPRDLLQEIRQAVSIPKNRLETPQITRWICWFLDQLDGLPQGDSTTYYLLLNAVHFCTNWIHLPPDNTADSTYQVTLDIANDLQLCIKESMKCFKQGQTLRKREEALHDIPGYATETLREKKKTLEDTRNAVRDFWDLIYASMIELDDSCYSSNSIIRREVAQKRKVFEKDIDFTDF